MKHLFLISVFCGLLFCCGCKKDESSPDAVKTDAAQTAVCASTVAVPTVDEEMALRRVLLKMQKPRLSEEKRTRLLERMKKNLLRDAANRQLIADELNRLRLDTSAEARTYEEEKYAQIFLRRGKIKTIPALIAELERQGVGQTFQANFEFDSRLETLLRERYGDASWVTEAEISNAFARIERMNALVEATNAVIYATASNVCRRAQSGEDFAVLVKTYSCDFDSEQPDGLIDAVDEVDFGAMDPNPWPVLSKLKVGEVTDVIDCDTGLYIFKALRQEAAEDSEDGPVMRFGQISLYRALHEPTCSWEEMRRIGEREAREKAIADLVKNLKQKKETEANENTK